MTLREFFETVFRPEVLGNSSKLVAQRHERAVAHIESAAGHAVTLGELTDDLLASVGRNDLSDYVANRHRQHLRRIIRYAQTKGLTVGPVSPMLPSHVSLTAGSLKGLLRDKAARETVDQYAAAGQLTLQSIEELRQLVAALSRRNVRRHVTLHCQLHVEVTYER